MITIRRRSPAFVATVIALPVAVITGVVVAAVTAWRNPYTATGPVTISPAPAAVGSDCTHLLDALPATLGSGYRPAMVGPPVPPGVRAWRPSVGGTAVVVRCGLNRPAGFTVTSSLQVVDGVQWFQSLTGPSTTDWYAVDRAVYVFLSMPSDVGPTPIQIVSDTISRTLPVRPIDPAPLLH